MSVDDEIDDFMDALRNALDYNLVAINHWDYWEETDSPSQEFFREVEGALIYAFRPIIRRYRDTRAGELLYTAREMMQRMVWASMNVPFPRHPELHAIRVVDNLMEALVEMAYAPIRTEMIMVNHNVQVLQRTWRRCISDPSRMACRRRLMNEYLEMAAV